MAAFRGAWPEFRRDGEKVVGGTDWYTGNWVVRRVYRQRRRLESDEAGEAGIVLYMM